MHQPELFTGSQEADVVFPDHIAAAAERGVNLWKVDDDTVSIACDEATTAQHIGIVLIELGVGITVAGVAISLFFAFAGRGR